MPDAEPGCSADHGGAPRADTNSQKSVPKYIYIYNDKIEDFSEFVAVFGRLDRGREDAGELEHDTRAHLSFDEDLGGVVIHVEPATDATYVRQEQVLQTKKIILIIIITIITIILAPLRHGRSPVARAWP